MKSKRLSILKTPDYIVELEYNESFVILHLPKVVKFTKSVYTEMMESFEEIKEFLRTIGFTELWCAVAPEDPRINKLAQRMGFEFIANADCLNVYLIRGI